MNSAYPHGHFDKPAEHYDAAGTFGCLCHVGRCREGVVEGHDADDACVDVLSGQCYRFRLASFHLFAPSGDTGLFVDGVYVITRTGFLDYIVSGEVQVCVCVCVCECVCVSVCVCV